MRQKSNSTVAGSSSGGAEMVTTLIAQMSDLLAPISKSTTQRSRPVPMGLCAVSRWCEGCRNKGKAPLSSEVNHRKTEIYLIFQYDMPERVSVNPH
jgi:hypothetical protein